MSVYRDEKLPKGEVINLFFDTGGLGDHIARMPAVHYLINEHPHCQFRIYVPDFFYDLAKVFMQPFLPLEVKRWTLRKNSQISKDVNVIEGKPGLITNVPRHTSMKTHLVDHSFHLLADRQPKMEERNYPRLPQALINNDKFNLPDKYIVVTTGYTAPARQWLSHICNEVVTWINDKGYTPVFLGARQVAKGADGRFDEDMQYDKGINLIDKTTLKESAVILARASAVVGLDNGLLHLAACSDVPIVMGFTSVDPFHRLPIRNDTLGWKVYPVVPPESLGCRFCQSRINFLESHDFKECYYKDYLCTKQLTSDKYIEALEKALNDT